MTNLDGLRGLAAFIVLVSHAGNFGMIVANKGNGQLGVMLFFVLSGFLMGHLYISNKNSLSFVEFWIKRFFRVIPLFVAVIFISYVVGKYKPGFLFPINDENILKHLLLSDGVWVLWTIPVEVKFYLLFPFLAILFQRIESKGYKLFIFSVWFLISCALVGGDRYSLLKYVNFFLLGIWVSFFRDILNERISKYGADILFLIWLASFWVVSPAMGPLFRLWGPQPLNDLPFLLWAGSGVLVATYNGRIMNALLSNPLSRLIGMLSYGIYLLHYPFLRALSRSSLPGFLEFMILLVAIMAIAWVSYRFFEAPMQKLGRKLIMRLNDNGIIRRV